MKLAMLPLLFLFAVGLAHPGADVSGAPLNQNVEVKVGQTVAIPDTRLKVTFQSVAEDSRCPEDVTCVWAGNAKVVLVVRGGGGPRATTINLNTGLNPKHLSYKGYDIKLVELNPHRKSNVKLDKGDYTVTLQVTKM